MSRDIMKQQFTRFDTMNIKNKQTFNSSNLAIASYLRLVGEIVPDIDNPKLDMFGDGYEFELHHRFADEHSCEDGKFSEKTKKQHLFGFEESSELGHSLFRFVHVNDEKFGRTVLLKMPNGLPVVEKLVDDRWVRPVGAPDTEYVELKPAEYVERQLFAKMTLGEFKELGEARKRERAIDPVAFTWEVVNRTHEFKTTLSSEYMTTNGEKRHFVLNPIVGFTQTHNFFPFNAGHSFRYSSFDDELFNDWDLNPNVSKTDGQADFNSDGTVKLVKYRNAKGKSSEYIADQIHPIIAERIVANNPSIDCSVLRDAIDGGITDKYLLAKIFWAWFPESGIPLHITEGALKSQSMLSAGKVAIGLAGMSMACVPKDQLKKEDIEQGNLHILRPRIAKLIGEKTKVIVALDIDTKEKTINNGHSARVAIEEAVRHQQGADCHVEHLFWNPSYGKGIDDVIASGHLKDVRSVGIGTNQLSGGFDTVEFTGEFVSADVFRDDRFPIKALNGGMGVGKTYSTKTYLDSLGSEKYIVSLANRVSLATRQATTYGVPTETADLYPKNLSVCFDSIRKVFWGKTLQIPDKPLYVLLDEWQSGYLHLLLSKTAVRTDRIWNMELFARMCILSVISGGNIIASDANLTDNSLEFLIRIIEDHLITTIGLCQDMLEPSFFDATFGRDGVDEAAILLPRLLELKGSVRSKLQVIKFTTTRKPLEYELTYGIAPTLFFANMVERAAQGERQAVLINSAVDTAVYIKENLIGLYRDKVRNFEASHIVIDRNTIAEVGHPACGVLSDPDAMNELVAKYRWVFFGSIFDSGESIDVRDHFDAAYVIGFSNGNPNSVAQMAGRVRDPGVKRYVWCSERARYNKKELFPNDVVNQTVEKAKAKAEKYGGGGGFNRMSNFELFESAIAKSQSNMCRQYFAEAVKFCLSASGIVNDLGKKQQAEIATGGNSAALKMKIKDTAYNLEDHSVKHGRKVKQEILDAPDATYEEVQGIRQKKAVTPVERATVTKSEVVDKFGKAEERHVESFKLGHHKKAVVLGLSLIGEHLVDAKLRDDMAELATSAYSYLDVNDTINAELIDAFRDERVRNFVAYGQNYTMKTDIVWKFREWAKDNFKLLNDNGWNLLWSWVSPDEFEYPKDQVLIGNIFRRFGLASAPMGKTGSAGNQVQEYRLCEVGFPVLAPKKKDGAPDKWVKKMIPIDESALADCWIKMKSDLGAVEYIHRVLADEVAKQAETSIARGMVPTGR